MQLSLSQKVLLFTICRSGHSSSYSPSPVLLTGDRIKRLLDPLILPTVDQFPLLTCGTQPARQVDSLHIEQREKASGLRLRFTCHFSFALAIELRTSHRLSCGHHSFCRLDAEELCCCDPIRSFANLLVRPDLVKREPLTGQALHAVWPAGSEGTLLQPLYQGVLLSELDLKQPAHVIS